MSSPREKQKASQLVAQFEAFAKRAGLTEGRCEVELCYGQVAKISVTFVLVSEIENANVVGKASVPQQIIREPPNLPSDIPGLDEWLETLVLFFRFQLAGCCVKFGTVSVDLKRGKVKRVTSAFCHLRDEVTGLEQILYSA